MKKELLKIYKEQRKNIDISYQKNNPLTNATIHFNSTSKETVLSVASSALNASEIQYMVVNAKTAETEETPEEATTETDETETITEENTKTAVFTGLVPGRIYNFYSVKSSEAEEMLSGDNLLYISQAVADENGSLSVEYIPDENVSEPVEFVAGMIYCIEKATVKTSDMDYTGEELTEDITVSYNGKLLEEGIDYQINGNLNVTKPGIYEIRITGIGDYYSEKIARFKVICNHEYNNGICTICGTVCSHSFENGVCTECGKAEFIKFSAIDVIKLKKILTDEDGFTIDLKYDFNSDSILTIVDFIMLKKQLIA